MQLQQLKLLAIILFLEGFFVTPILTQWILWDQEFISKQFAIDNSFSNWELPPFHCTISPTREQLSIVEVHKSHTLSPVLEKISPFAMFFWVTL